MYNFNVKRIKIIVVIVFLLGLFLRISVMLSAHHGDLNNNISWGTVAYEHGLKGFYEGKGLPLNNDNRPVWPNSAPNQPPLTILMFTGCRFIWQNVRDIIWYLNWELLIFPSKLVWFWDGYGMDVLVKFPSILADLGIGFLVFKYFAEKNKHKIGLILASVWLINPVTWYNSAVWGQTDSVVNFLGLIAILALLKKKLVRFSVFLTLSILFKGSLAMFIPILLFVAIKQKHGISVWLRAMVYSLFAVIIISIWFHPKFDLFIWLASLYKYRILPGELQNLTANAFNFWWLVNGGRMISTPGSFGLFDNIPYYGLYMFGLSARIWGYFINIIGIVVILKWLSKKISDKRILFSLSLMALVSFLFLTRMHERYLFPFFPISTILLGVIPNIWPVYAILSLTHIINLYNLFWVPPFPILENLLKNPFLPNLLSVISILMLPLAVLLNGLHGSKKL